MKVTKRQLVAGSIATVGFGTIAFTPAVRAESIDIDGLTVADISHDSPDGDIQDVSVTIAADYAFEATTEVDTLRFTLRAGRSADSTTELATQSVDLNTETDSGTVELTGPITYSSAFDIADFRPAGAGEETQNTVWFILEAELQNTFGDVIAETSATDDATINVTQQEDVLSFSIGGTGEIEISG